MKLHELIAKYKNISNYAYSSNETKFNSYEMGVYINKNNIKGSIVECGVAAAANFAFMMLGEKESNTGIKRKYWGFDSFQGIQLAGKNDSDQPGTGKIKHNVNVPEDDLLISSGVTSVSKNQVIQNLQSWNLYDNVELIEGWIQKSLSNDIVNDIGKISILRLDMDIYAPTKFALEKLYSSVEIGGVIIIDDWALLGAKTACLEFFKENDINVNIKTIENSTPIYFIKE